MKRILSIIVSVVMIILSAGVVFAAPGGPEEGAEEPAAIGGLLGGWTVYEDTAEAELPEEVKAAFDKALEGYVGMNFTPIAYLGSQVVSGTNYMILCKGAPVVLDPQTGLYVVVIYADLEGNATITNVADFDIAAIEEGNAAGEAGEEAGSDSAESEGGETAEEAPAEEGEETAEEGDSEGAEALLGALGSLLGDSGEETADGAEEAAEGTADAADGGDAAELLGALGSLFGDSGEETADGAAEAADGAEDAAADGESEGAEVVLGLLGSLLGGSGEETAEGEETADGEDAFMDFVGGMFSLMLGGWSVPEAPEAAELPEDAAAAFSAVTESLLGVDYVPVALLGTKVISGTEYAILAHSTIPSANPTSYYSVLFIAANADQTYELLNGAVLYLAEFNEAVIDEEEPAE